MAEEILDISGRTVVISDTHFGDRTELLDDASLVDRLTAALSEGGPVEELVLLGDLVDLWVKTTVPALRKARYFVASMSRLPGLKRIVYVPGNHDHKMFMDAFTDEVDRKVLEGDLTTPKFMPSRHYRGTVISGLADAGQSVSWSLVYPFIVRRLHGREVVLCHGHHLDFYDTSFGWARTFWLGRRVIQKRKANPTLHDIEMANLPFCGTMSVFPWVPELVQKGLRYYRIINFFARLFRQRDMMRSPRRDTLIKDNYDEIEGLLPLFGHHGPGCFIFGHTHRPGIGRIPGSGVTVANCGCWTAVDDPEVPNMTWIEITDDVKLFRLDSDGAEFIYGESI